MCVWGGGGGTLLEVLERRIAVLDGVFDVFGGVDHNVNSVRLFFEMRVVVGFRESSELK